MSSYNLIEKMLIVHVRDSGSGFTQDGRSKLFRRYGKLQSENGSAYKNQEGIGIGLTICKAIIFQNEGQIEAFSQGPDCGSVFAFSMKMESIPCDELEVISFDETIEEDHLSRTSLEEITVTGPS